MSYWRATQLERSVLLGLLLLAAVIEISQVDLLLGDWLYQLEGGAWSLRSNFWTQTVLHDGAKILIQAVMLLVLIAVLGQRLRLGRQPIRGIEVALIAIVISVVITAIVKTVSNVSCPWGLLRYGGDHPYVSIFRAGHGLDLGACFPAGHASAGYSLFAFYFLARINDRRSGFFWLVIALSIGLVLDVVQQLRGAHFLSHGLWTVIIVWAVNLGVFAVFYPSNAQIDVR
ncbi:MAG: hypothetical protein NWQ45_01545 [Congregibacter sp.]|nr:hypothetical protein [Congregibacter sp.]